MRSSRRLAWPGNGVSTADRRGSNPWEPLAESGPETPAAPASGDEQPERGAPPGNGVREAYDGDGDSDRPPALRNLETPGCARERTRPAQPERRLSGAVGGGRAGI